MAGVVAAASLGAAGSTAAAAPHSEPAVPEPVPSLTPAATEELWTRLVEQPRPQVSSAAECRPLRAVFYAATDWLRLATKLAANPSPCAQYSISVPPLAADKTQLRSGQAAQIRALGPAFHALAEINVTGWTSWVASNGGSWYEAGVEARRRMAAAGFDVAAGDSWAVNELSSAVRQGTGNARANMRAFLQGLHDGDGGPAARGAVFVIGISQPTSDLSLYQARLQDWYEDAAFWSDVNRYVSDWSQELYGDVRNYAAPATSREARRDALNEYLQHEPALAAVAPAAGEAARAFLDAAYNPLANAAWRYDAAFGWTDVPVELMQDYVSAQTYATRSAGNGRFGFAWSPRNLTGVAAAEFNAQTDALLVRLAGAITDSADLPEAACGPTACAGELAGATLTTAWRTFASWKPSALGIASPPQTLAPGVASAPVTIELRTHGGGAYTAGLPVPVELSSSSPTAGFSTGPAGPWTGTLATSIASGASTTGVFFRDVQSGSPTIVAATPGKTTGTQIVTVTAPDTTPTPPPPPAPTPPPPSPSPSPPPPSSGGGAGPDLAVAASAEPAAPVVGANVTYAITVRNLGSPASRAHLAVQLPAQVGSAVARSDRGAGCTGTTILSCELDFLSGDLVATVRVDAVVREGGALTLTATSSSEPGDVQRANDTATVVTLVAAAPPAAPAARPAPNPRPILRLVGRTPAGVTRTGGAAQIALLFWVSERVRLEAQVTPLGSTRPISLLPGTTLAGRRATTLRTSASATVPRGTYALRARIGAALLPRGRLYLVRLVALDAAGERRSLVVRVRA